MAKTKGRDMDEVPVKSGNNKVRASDLVDVYDIPEKWTRLRFHGPVYTYGTHWVKTKTKDGKPTKFPTPCLAYDAETGQRDSTKHCPWCKFQAENKSADRDENKIDFSVEYWSNVIVRSEQKKKPSEVDEPTKKEAKTGFKDKDSESWTPNRAVRLSGSLMRKLKDLKALNTHDTDDGTTAYSVSHVKYGCDVQLKLNKEGSPADKYGVQKGDHTPMKKEERGYLIYDLSTLQQEQSEEEVDAEFASWDERNNGGKKSKKKAKDEDDEDDEKPKKKGKVIDDDDDDEPKSKKKKVVDDDDDDDEDEKPSKSKKKAKDEDDEDDEPKSKKSKKSKDDDEDDDPPPKKSKTAKDDDDDDDDDPPPKSKKRSKDEDDEDEDDEPKSKKKKVVEDEDDDDDDPPPKKSKKKSKDDEDEDDDPPPKSKKKVVEDDDDDDEPKSKKKSKKAKDEDDDFDDDD